MVRLRVKITVKTGKSFFCTPLPDVVQTDLTERALEVLSQPVFDWGLTTLCTIVFYSNNNE